MTLQQESLGVAARSGLVGEAQQQGRTTRLLGLDVVKGAMLLVSVGVDSWVHVPAWFNHAVWVGVHPMDYIFPVFVTLSGCGLGFANARRVRVRPALRRIVILVAVGLIYNMIVNSGVPFHLSLLRVPGVLQLYAGVVAGIVALHLVLKSWKAWAAVTVVLAVVYTLILGLWAAHCGGQLTPTCNPSHVIDFAVFGRDHLYFLGQLGYDPEGLPSILGALVAASMGSTIGHLLLEHRGQSSTALLRAAVPVVVGGIALALVLEAGVPAFKNQWTPPFSLLLASAAAVALLVGHLAIDRIGLARRGDLQHSLSGDLRLHPVVWLLVALGRNSLFVYFGSHALTAWLSVHAKEGVSELARLERAISLGGHPQATLTIAAEMSWLSLAALLHWRKIYLRP